MPLYEYKCEKCEHLQEELNSVAGRFDGPDCTKCMGFCRLTISTPADPVLNPARPVHKPQNM